MVAGSASAALDHVALPATSPADPASGAEGLHAALDHLARLATVQAFECLAGEATDMRGRHWMCLRVLLEMVKDCRIQGYNCVSHWWA